MSELGYKFIVETLHVTSLHVLIILNSLRLSICFEIVVEKHCGKLWYDSAPGGGTKFMIQIPILALSEEKGKGKRVKPENKTLPLLPKPFP
ncbi:hypothetical protein RIVM261_062030 [Rivularia sp. IAM M-261]|nr:hypothetical protein RIVM261_062030 [Rivularia sp. IAM M-261]